MFAFVLKVVHVLMGREGMRLLDEEQRRRRETGLVSDFVVITVELLYSCST